MKNILIAIRSIFKKGRHNVMKIVSLGIGLAVGLVLIAKVYFEQSYDDFIRIETGSIKSGRNTSKMEGS